MAIERGEAVRIVLAGSERARGSLADRLRGAAVLAALGGGEIARSDPGERPELGRLPPEVKLPAPTNRAERRRERRRLGGFKKRGRAD